MSARSAGFGRTTRLWIGLQVLALGALAFAAALLVIELASWAPLRVRADLTRTGRNTLDPSTLRILADLPEPIEVDVFHDDVLEPNTAVANQVYERLEHFLLLLGGMAPERVKIRRFQLKDAAAARARQVELGYEQAQPHVAVTRGARTEVLLTFRDLAQVDWGRAGKHGVPPVLELFTAEDAFVRAVAAVSESPRIVFSTGHREPGLADEQRIGLARARELLERDGFDVAEWDARTAGGIPEDCDVLAIVAPRSPLGEKTVAHVRSWVERGGRLLLVLGPTFSSEPGTDFELAAAFGMQPRDGVVCLPVLTTTGQAVEGFPECADLGLGQRNMSAEHPLTASIREREVTLRFVRSLSFERGTALPGGTLLDVLSSGEGSWLDLPGPDGFGNYALDQPEEPFGRFLLAMVAELPAATTAAGAPAQAARVVGIAAADAFSNSSIQYNRDLWLNACNWLAERESRVRVAPRDPRRSVIEVQRGPNLGRFLATGWFGLAGVCVLLGAFTAWKRRR